VKACNVLDPACAAPAAAQVTTDDGGIADLTLKGDFTGFYQFARADLLPTTLYTGQLLAGDTDTKVPAPLLSVNAVRLLASSIGVSFDLDPDGGVGHLFVNMFDCQDRHAPGVEFTISNRGAQTTTFYTKSGLPSTSATQTDTLGAGGAVNVPVGLITVSATLAGTTRSIGSLNVVIRPGGATFAWVRPRVH
jgi:hypothetical protein